MAAPKDTGDARPGTEPHSEAVDSDIDFAGYDPYIVAITGGVPADVGHDAVNASDRSPEGRKVKLMTWLRQHGA